jgi:hypothetical protein
MYWLIFSFDEDETKPQSLGFGHNLKEKNLCKVNTEQLENDEYNMHIYTTHNNHNIDIYIKFDENKVFKDGYVLNDYKRYDVNDFELYSSLQIKDLAYDRIIYIKIGGDIFI